MDYPMIELAQAVIGIVLLCFVVIRCYGQQRRDQFRCDIRQIRDNLFDVMHSTGRSYGDPGYQRTRKMLNGTLRLSNHLGIVWFFVVIWWVIKAENAGYQPTSGMDETQDGELRVKLAEVYKAVQLRLIQFLFLEGSVGWLVRGVEGTLHLFHGINRAKTWAMHKSDQFLAGATQMGSAACAGR